MRKNNLLILFSKWPESGNCKSRISSTIGYKYTIQFCFACLDDIIDKIKLLQNIDFIIISNDSSESNKFLNRYNVPSFSLEKLKIPYNQSLSEIFYDLFNYFLKIYKKVSLIPMDIPHINSDIILQSFNLLEDNPQVFGPEKNGGVYLIGIKKLSKNIFRNVRWSTAKSCNDLLNNCKHSKRLEENFDLNTLEDLLLLSNNLLSSCPQLRKFIKSLVLKEITREGAMVYERNRNQVNL